MEIFKELQSLSQRGYKLTVGDIEDFERIVKVDYEHFMARIQKVTPKLDKHGNAVTDEDGSVIMIPDAEAMNNPQPLPNRFLGLRVLLWLANRKFIKGLKLDDLKDLPLTELRSILMAVTEGDEDDADPFTETSQKQTGTGSG